MASIPEVLKYQANLAGVPDLLKYQANLAGVPDATKKPCRTREKEIRSPSPTVRQDYSHFSLLQGSVLFDLRLERLTGKEDATLDRSQGDVQRVGDLIVMIAANVHGEGHTQLVVQLADGLRDLL